jgi:flagellar basal body-associated protein FliL
MSFSKLKRIHVIIIGVVVLVIAGAGVFFLQVKPQMDAYKEAKAKYEKESVKGNETAKADAIRQRELATLAFNQAQALLDVQMKRRMPYLNFSRRDIGMLALWA